MKDIILVLIIILAVLAYAPSHAQYSPQPLPNPTMIHGAGGCTPNWSTGGCL